MIRSSGWMLESIFLRLRVTIDVTCVLARPSEIRQSAVATVRESRAVRGAPSTPVSSSGSQSVSARLRSRDRTGQGPDSPVYPNRAQPAVLSSGTPRLHVLAAAATALAHPRDP